MGVARTPQSRSHVMHYTRVNPISQLHSLSQIYISSAVMAFPFEVCNICLDRHGKNKHKVDSLIESKCLRRLNPHESVTVRVRFEGGILEPEVRPMPKVYFRGHFVFCDPKRCIGRKCTFPHCSKEKEEWNRQKFSPPPLAGLPIPDSPRHLSIATDRDGG